MKSIARILVTLAAVFAVKSASAEAWNCTLDGNANGFSAGFIFGVQGLEGPGVLSCESDSGEQISQDVQLKLVGAGWTLFDITVVRNVQMHSANIMLTGDPEAIFDSFSIALSSGVTLFELGLDVDAAFKVMSEGVSFEVGLMNREAFGLGLRIAHGMIFSISPR